MNNTMAALPNPEIQTIIPEMGADRPKKGIEMTYLKKNTIDKAIHQKIRMKGVYRTDLHKIYNLILGQKN